MHLFERRAYSNSEILSEQPPKAEGGDEECSSGSPAVGAASPAGGVCVYLTRCAAARHIAAEDYAKSYCVVNDRYLALEIPSVSRAV